MTHARGPTFDKRLRALEIKVAVLEVWSERTGKWIAKRLKEEAEARALV